MLHGILPTFFKRRYEGGGVIKTGIFFSGNGSGSRHLTGSTVDYTSELRRGHNFDTPVVHTFPWPGPCYNLWDS